MIVSGNEAIEKRLELVKYGIFILKYVPENNDDLFEIYTFCGKYFLYKEFSKYVKATGTVQRFHYLREVNKTAIKDMLKKCFTDNEDILYGGF